MWGLTFHHVFRLSVYRLLAGLSAFRLFPPFSHSPSSYSSSSQSDPLKKSKLDSLGPLLKILTSQLKTKLFTADFMVLPNPPAPTPPSKPKCPSPARHHFDTLASSLCLCNTSHIFPPLGLRCSLCLEYI